MSTTEPVYQEDGIEMYQCDAGQWLSERDACSIDCIVTDPPYWTLNRWRNVGTTTRLGGHHDKEKQNEDEWFETIDQNDLWELMCEFYRVLKPNCHCYIMCDGQTLKHVLGYAEEAGFSNANPIVWDKVNQGMGYHYRCRHEFFVLLDKGKNRKLNNLSTPDVWEIPMLRGAYPTEKPVKLMEIPIEHSTKKGELVLDSFMGSGSVLRAAKNLERRAIGIDISIKAIEHATQRKQIRELSQEDRELFSESLF